MTNLAPERTTSRREQNKLDKLRRIRAASLELFMTKGYDDATTREIAALAGVGLGTVYDYAETKRDLLFLIVNDDLEKTVTAAAAAVKPTRTMLANFLTIARLHYELLRTQPDIWRLALREMIFYASGVQAQRFLRTRERLIQLFAKVASDGLAAAGSKDDPKLIGWMAFSLFQIDLRRFIIRDDLDVDKATTEVAKQYRILARTAARVPAKSKSRR